MAQHSVTVEIAKPIDEVFQFFATPINVAKLAPPDLHLELVDGPTTLQLGSRVAWKARRWGISQKIVQEVTQFEPGKLIVEEQKQGPFARWVVARHFSPTDGGTQLREEIQFEPPGGLLGFMVTEKFIRNDLDKIFEYRASQLKTLFGG